MTNGAPYVSATAYNHLMCGEIHKMHPEREVNRDSGGLNERFNVNKYKTIREMAHTVTDARMRKTEGGRQTGTIQSEEDRSNNAWKWERRGLAFQPWKLQGHWGRLAGGEGFLGEVAPLP